MLILPMEGGKGKRVRWKPAPRAEILPKQVGKSQTHGFCSLNGVRIIQTLKVLNALGIMDAKKERVYKFVRHVSALSGCRAKNISEYRTYKAGSCSDGMCFGCC